MKNFLLLNPKIDPEPFLNEISNVPFAWDRFTTRQKKIKVQRESKGIPLRGLRKSKIQGRNKRDVHETRDTTMSRNYPYTMEFMRNFATQMNGRLGRAKFAMLPPGKMVHTHIDRGDYYLARDRFHLVLQTAEGNYLASGNEKTSFKRGELWWFDNDLPHEAYNGSDRERIHLIFDVEPVSPDFFVRNRYREQLVSEPMAAETSAEEATKAATFQRLLVLPPDKLEQQFDGDGLALIQELEDGHKDFLLLTTDPAKVKAIIRQLNV